MLRCRENFLLYPKTRFQNHAGIVLIHKRITLVERKRGNKIARRKNEERRNTFQQSPTPNVLLLHLIPNRIPNRLLPKEEGLQRHPNPNFRSLFLGTRSVFPRPHRDWCQRNPKSLCSMKQHLNVLETIWMHLHHLAAGRRSRRIDI